MLVSECLSKSQHSVNSNKDVVVSCCAFPRNGSMGQYYFGRSALGRHLPAHLAVSATAKTEADSITGLPLFLFKLLNSWREYVSGVVLAVVVSVAVLIVVAVGRDFGCDIVVVVLGALLF